MRKTAVLIIFTFLSFGVLAQTSKDYTQKGRELIDKRDYMEAILNLNKAIELDTKNASAYFLRATLKEKFEDLHGAMKDYNSAIESNPKSAETFFARGNVKMRLQDYYGAIEDFSAAISVNENFVEAYFSRGKAKQLLLAYEDAINDVTKIIQINPKSVDAYYMRGILRIDFGDMKNGCLDLSKAGELGDLRAYEVIKEKCNTKVTGN
jgi:tetratricopeptide (TPR) repeat protein